MQPTLNSYVLCGRYSYESRFSKMSFLRILSDARLTFIHIRSLQALKILRVQLSQNAGLLGKPDIFRAIFQAKRSQNYNKNWQ